MKRKKVLVTGGAGFIGSHLVDRLIKGGHTVSIIDDLSGGKKQNINPKAKFFKIDLRDSVVTEKVIKKIRPELVFHLAANAAENKAQFSPIDITSGNFDGSTKVLTAAIRNGVKRFIF